MTLDELKSELMPWHGLIPHGTHADCGGDQYVITGEAFMSMPPKYAVFCLKCEMQCGYAFCNNVTGTPV